MGGWAGGCIAMFGGFGPGGGSLDAEKIARIDEVLKSRPETAKGASDRIVDGLLESYKGFGGAADTS